MNPLLLHIETVIVIMGAIINICLSVSCFGLYRRIMLRRTEMEMAATEITKIRQLAHEHALR